MIDLERNGDVFTMTLNAGENRWNTTFVREIASVLDEVEASSGPAALVTASASEKFFSNGLDLAWVQKPDDFPAAGDRKVFGPEFMTLMARLITLPLPTVCVVNGHAFGAGFMAAMCHDVRIMREDRGFMCANEMQLGMSIPSPELALFRHKMPRHVFHKTVQLAHRWAGPHALDAGLVESLAPVEGLLALAQSRAAELAPLAASRENFGGQKERLYGENSAINEAHGPAYMLRNSHLYAH
jgi:enoyl-CoA hydratase/carnithine racemase